MGHNHNILAFQKRRQAFQHGGDAGLHLAKTLPAWRVFFPGMGPKGMRGARQQRGQGLMRNTDEELAGG